MIGVGPKRVRRQRGEPRLAMHYIWQKHFLREATAHIKTKFYATRLHRTISSFPGLSGAKIRAQAAIGENARSDGPHHPCIRCTELGVRRPTHQLTYRALRRPFNDLPPCVRGIAMVSDLRPLCASRQHRLPTVPPELRCPAPGSRRRGPVTPLFVPQSCANMSNHVSKAERSGSRRCRVNATPIRHRHGQSALGACPDQLRGNPPCDRLTSSAGIPRDEAFLRLRAPLSALRL